MSQTYAKKAIKPTDEYYCVVHFRWFTVPVHWHDDTRGMHPEFSIRSEDDWDHIAAAEIATGVQ